MMQLMKSHVMVVLVMMLCYVAKKFEDLVEASSETEGKLKRLFEIPDKERASCSGVTVTEASFSSEFTPSMSSVPSSSAKFSLMDVKAKMMKKKEKPEKSEEAVIPNPVHVVATRSKGSTKKRKAPDSVTDLESFEGLTAAEVKEKMHTHYSMLHLGYERILELMKDQEVELRDLKETCANLKGMLAIRLKLEETHAKEIEELQAKAEEEKKKVVEDAQESAVNAVYESMYEMAKEAAEKGFTLPHWDVQGWGEVIGKKAKVKAADSQETQVAPDAGGAGGGADGEGIKVTGDDSINA